MQEFGGGGFGETEFGGQPETTTSTAYTRNVVSMLALQLNFISRIERLLRGISFSSPISFAVNRLKLLLRSSLAQVSIGLSVLRIANLLRSGLAKISQIINTSRTVGYLRSGLVKISQIINVSRIARYLRSGLALVNYGLSVRRIANYLRLNSTQIGVGFSVSRIASYLRSVYLNTPIAGTVRRTASYLRNMAMAIGIKASVAESLLGAAITYRTVSTIISIQSIATRVAEYIRALAIIWSVSSVYDFGQYNQGLYESGSTQHPSFSLSRTKWYSRIVGTLVTVSIHAVRLGFYLRSIALVGNIRILAGRVGRYLRTLSNRIVSVILVVRSVSGGMTVRLVSTTIDIAVNVSRIGRYLRTINEIIASSYAADKLRRFYRTIVGIVPVSVALNRIKTFVRSSVVTIAVLFSTMRIGYYLRTISSSVTSGHLIGRIGQYIRSVYYYAFPIEVVISDDSSESHGNSVRDAVIEGYGSNIRVKTRLGVESYATSIAKAVSMRASVLVRSFAGVENHLTESDSCYPTVLTFWPLGSNSYVELTALSSIPVSVTSGGGTTQNDTAYGDGLEFWDDGSGGSSAANGRIAGKLLKIKHSRGGSWWDARYAARQTASNGGVWDKFNGYGKIDVAAAIAYGGSVPADDYANGNPELGQIQNVWVVGTWLSAWQTYFRNAVTSIGVKTRTSGNPILTLIYKILSKFISIDKISSSPFSVVDEITSTTKEVD